MPLPDHVPFSGPTYDAETGRVRMGVSDDDDAVPTWQLVEPGVGVCHGLILGPAKIGKTNVLRILTMEAALTGIVVPWLADPSSRHNLAGIWGNAIDHIARNPSETEDMLGAAAAVIQAREKERLPSYQLPSGERPAVLLLIDECQYVFSYSPSATKLAELIVSRGRSVGVGLVVTTLDSELFYFGGSRALRNRLAEKNLCCMGTKGLEQLQLLQADLSTGHY